MRAFLLNLLLAFTWCAASGALNTPNFIVGFLVGFAVLGTQTDISRGKRYRRKGLYFVAFLLYFGKEIAAGALDVAFATVWPYRKIRPGIVAVPMSVRSAVQQTLLANAVTLTPGTLSIDISPDGRTLYVHVMDMESPDEVRDKIKNGLEAHLLRLFS